jgi:hypothetical protein
MRKDPPHLITLAADRPLLSFRPTYYGIDMWALSLWTKYGPSNSSLASRGPLMLAGLWDTMGEYYNANLKNFAGPYDRTYGNGMKSVESATARC